MIRNTPLLSAAGLLTAWLCILAGQHREGTGIVALEPRAESLSPGAGSLERGQLRPAHGPRPARGQIVQAQAGHLSAGRGTREISGPGLGIDVLVREEGGTPIPGVPLVVERQTANGSWLELRCGHLDRHGQAHFGQLPPRVLLRLRTVYPSVLPTRTIYAPAALELVLTRPSLAGIDLRSQQGDLLGGACRVELQLESAGGQRTIRLSRGACPGRWEALLEREAHGLLLVQDSLGRWWRSPVSLVPGQVGTARPDRRWLVLHRRPAPERFWSPSPRRERLRWALQVGEGAARRGSAWTLPDRGLHAVVPAGRSRSEGGRLELSWHGPKTEREHDCAWHPDATLESIEF